MTDETNENDDDDDDDVEFYRCEECGNWYLTRQQLQAHSHIHKDDE